MQRIIPIGKINGYPIISDRDYNYLRNYEPGRIYYDDEGFETIQFYLEYERFIRVGKKEPEKYKEVNHFKINLGGKIITYNMDH